MHSSSVKLANVTNGSLLCDQCHGNQSLFKYESNGFGPFSFSVFCVGRAGSARKRRSINVMLIASYACFDHLLESGDLGFASLPFTCRQFSHSDSVIFLSLFTSQYLGIFLPHFFSALKRQRKQGGLFTSPQKKN